MNITVKSVTYIKNGNHKMDRGGDGYGKILGEISI